VFLLSVQNLCDKYFLLLPFQSLNIMQYGWKTSSKCRTILILLATKGSEWYICRLVGTQSICETAKYQHA
jgi:hypothetical protein